jgi:hypothetical protein
MRESSWLCCEETQVTILEILSLKQEKGEAVINKLSTRPFIVLMM